MESFANNCCHIESRIDTTLEILSKHYILAERTLEEFAALDIAQRHFEIRQFDIAGVGNLLTMESTNDASLQMSTVTITPYFKNLPLFSTDYMYAGDGRSFLIEFYDLLGSNDELFNRYLERFANNLAPLNALESMQLPPCWYDGIRPILASKRASAADDDLIEEAYFKNLETLIKMERESPLLYGPDLEYRKLQNREYARKLVDVGGVSTALFAKAIGDEATKRFFFEVFFAPDLYADQNPKTNAQESRGVLRP